MLSESQHLSKVLEYNDCPRSFISSSATDHREVKEQEQATDSNGVTIACVGYQLTLYYSLIFIQNQLKEFLITLQVDFG